MSRWKFSFPAQLPENSSETWTVGITEKEIDLLYRKGHTEKLVRARLAEDVVQAPDVIIRGWGRNKEECWVYVGSPDHDLRGDGSIHTPPQKGRLFLVFILPDGTIDDWCWRDAKAGDPGMPDGMKGDIVWPVN